MSNNTTGESLNILQRLLSEFYNVQTTNKRKREIEQLLANFSQQKDAWRHCICFLNDSQEQGVLMFATRVLEDIVNKKWIGVDANEKREFRSTLPRLLLAKRTDFPIFVRNKLVKVIVDIARLDWPHFYPNFFNDMQEIISEPSTTSLGLYMLLTTSEELIQPRENVIYSRKLELKRLLLNEVPKILSMLSTLLDSLLDKYQVARHITPSTSPTSLRHNETGAVGLDLFSVSPSSYDQNDNSTTENDNIVQKLLRYMPSRQAKSSIQAWNVESKEIAALALQCLADLFSWIPLSSLMTTSLLTTIFGYASFGCQTGDGHQLGTLAMDCINEIVSKNCVPEEFEEFLLKLFQETYQLLQDLVIGQNINFADLDEKYLDKFTEFLRLFVNVHLQRFTNSPYFPLSRFFELLFKYTFLQHHLDGYYACLEIWEFFIEHLKMQIKAESNNHAKAENIINKYRSILTVLASSIIKKIQSSENYNQIEALSNDVMDEEDETDLQVFLKNNIEIIASISEIQPESILQTLFDILKSRFSIFSSIEQYLVQNAQGRCIEFPDNQDGNYIKLQFHCALRDLSTCIQALGRMSEHFVDALFMERFQNCNTLLDGLTHVCFFATKLQLYNINCESSLLSTIMEVHIQSMAAIQAFSPWLCQFHAHSQGHIDRQKMFYSLLNQIVDAVIPLLQKSAKTPEKLAYCAACLLLTLATSIRTSMLLDIRSIQDMTNMNSGITTFDYLPQKVQVVIFKMLSNTIILPWNGVKDSDQRWEERSEKHSSFVRSTTLSLTNTLQNQSIQQDSNLISQAVPMIKSTLMVLCSITESVTNENMKSKTITYKSIESSIHNIISSLSLFTPFPDLINEVMDLIYSLFNGLLSQCGMAFAKQILETFMHLFSKQQLFDILSKDGGREHSFVEKFIKIIQLLVVKPGSAVKELLPNILSFCMDQVYPLAKEFHLLEVKYALMEVLYQYLSNNWRYFFPSNMDQREGDTVNNPQHFMAIMQVLGEAFLQPDISLFKQSLEILDNLNKKCKLYEKPIFQQDLLFEFMNVLFHALVDRSHELLQEEMTCTIYAMASISFSTFYSVYVPQMISKCEMLTSHQRERLQENLGNNTDLPTFVQSLTMIVSDLRYYQLCNNSLPPGVISFD